MKIVIGKSDPENGVKRHVVLICSQEEEYDVHRSLVANVLDPRVLPRRERLRASAQVRFRLSMKYLDKVMLTFPYAEFSPGLETRLSKKAIEEFRAMRVPRLDIEGLRLELFDFQKIAVAKMMKRRNFLLNDEMGLGKTIQALAAIIGRQAYPALVVVPNSIKFNWKRFVEQYTDATCQVVDGTAAQRKQQILKRSDITIINCEGLRVKESYRYETRENGTRFRVPVIEPVHPDLFSIEWEMAVVDEYHKFKNPYAQMTKGLHMIRSKVKVGMSGTPLLNGRPEEVWSILHWMYPRRFPTFHNFMDKHVERLPSGVIQYKGLHEVRDFFQSRSMRRRKEWVEDDLPEVVYADHYIDLTAEQKKLYKAIRDELLLWVDEEPRKIANVLAQMTRLKQACFSPELYDGSQTSAKIAEVKEIMQELVANGEKAIIFSQWSRATRILQRELAEYNPAYVDGTVKAKDRMAQIDKFNEDEDCKVFIGTIGSCKEGFTLSAATYVIFTDKGWTPAENAQAAARSAAGGLRGRGRGGQKVHIIEVKANDTIEEYIDEMLKKKEQMNARMVERDGGQKFERITMTDLRAVLAA